MAIAYLGFKVFGRDHGKAGSVATSAAAYRSGERIRDERTGAVYDHSQRRDVMHKEILLPWQYQQAGAALDWARDRGRLWNAAEQAEKRQNSRVAREYVVALPHELGAEQRLVLAQSFGRMISERYGNAVDLAVHAPRNDPRNFHAHLLTTTRQVTLQGLGEKTTIEWSGARRHAHGLARYDQEYRDVRQAWLGMTNEFLREAGLEQRIGGRDRAALPDRWRKQEQEQERRRDRVWLPKIAYQIEKRGGHSFVGDMVRREFQQRQQLQQQLPEPQPARQQHEPQRQPEPSLDWRGRPVQSMKEAADQGLRDWLARKERARLGLEPEPHKQGQEHAKQREWGMGDDYGL